MVTSFEAVLISFFFFKAYFYFYRFIMFASRHFFFSRYSLFPLPSIFFFCSLPPLKRKKKVVSRLAIPMGKNQGEAERKRNAATAFDFYF